MFLQKIIFPALLLLTLAACQKEEMSTMPDPVTPVTPSNPALPSGAFASARSGVFQKQNGYNAEGTAQLGTDAVNAQWLRLAPDFNASLSTGAVTVYLSKNQNLTLGAADSFRRVDLVKTPGEHFYKIEPAVGADFKFAILWCASAGVQFGNAELK
jgi:hypothetical protein